MSIASVASNLWNTKKTLFSTEDTFDDFGVDKEIVNRVTDVVSAIGGHTDTSPSEIIITCKNKNRRVHGYLSNGVKISGKANWRSFVDSGVFKTVKSVMDDISDVVQAWGGASMQQPWMNRKLWVSTDPFSFDFSFNFISDGNTGKTDVYLPAETLLSFIYPRSLGTATQIKNFITNNIPFLDPNATNTRGEKNVLGSAIDTFTNAFRIPGPGLKYNGEGSDSGDGDAVTIVIGNLFAFGGVYLENVDLEFSPVMDNSGYPIWCKCNVKATAMDVNYCDYNGNFVISQYKDSQAELSGFLDAMKTTATDAVADTVNIAKATIDAIKAPI